MLSAATLPAATARMTVAGPDTASPPAKTLPLPGTKDELSAWMAPQLGADAARLKGLGMDGLTDGHDHIVAGDAQPAGCWLSWGRGARSEPTRPMIWGWAHSAATRPFSSASIRAGAVQGQNLAALGLGLVDLLRQGGHILHPAAVHAGDMGGAQPQAGAGGIHGDVAAPDDHHPLARQVGDCSLRRTPAASARR